MGGSLAFSRLLACRARSWPSEDAVLVLDQARLGGEAYRSIDRPKAAITAPLDDLEEEALLEVCVYICKYSPASSQS
jgi:hypothetical protein